MSTWRDSLPEAVQTNPELDRIKAETPEEAITALTERVSGMRQKLGAAIPVPGKDASAEDSQAFEERLAGLGFSPSDVVPEDASGYSAEADATGIPPEVADQYVEQRRQYYKRAGVGAKTARKLLAEDMNDLRNAMTGYHRDVELATATVQKLWGDSAPQGIRRAQRGAELAGITDLMEAPLFTLDGKVVSLGNRPELMNMLSEIGKRLGEDKGANVNGDGAQPSPDAQDVESLKDERTLKLKQFSELMRGNPGDPELRLVRAEIRKLNQRITAQETGDASIIGMTPERMSKLVGKY